MDDALSLEVILNTYPVTRTEPIVMMAVADVLSNRGTI